MFHSTFFFSTTIPEARLILSTFLRVLLSRVVEVGEDGTGRQKKKKKKITEVRSATTRRVAWYQNWEETKQNHT
jgi:hypothetical protein